MKNPNSWLIILKVIEEQEIFQVITEMSLVIKLITKKELKNKKNKKQFAERVARTIAGEKGQELKDMFFEALEQWKDIAPNPIVARAVFTELNELFYKKTKVR